MVDWVFLSKDGQDEYINAMAAGAGTVAVNTEAFDYDVGHQPIVLRGILKHKIMKRCWEDHRDFYYMDTGYFGNNRVGKKLWHRIVKNDLQHNEIVNRPDDRWRRFGIPLQPRRYGGRIVVAVPDDKPCQFYDISRQEWINNVISTLKKHTDREIVIRERAPDRRDRVLTDPLKTVLQNDVHALVTFNSVAATEAILNGVPAFVIGAANAATPVANQDLAQIEDPYWASDDKIYAWACHLAYGQFHVHELKNGNAIEILKTS